MTRLSRKCSSSNIYHVMARGVGRLIIFEDEADRSKYVRTLARFSKACAVEVLAWCLMENHVHLLLHGDLSAIQDLMKRLGDSYVAYYNAHHDRVGHLFQGRFASEPVEDDTYLMTVVRYIHLNPVVGGLSPSPSYAWSSYNDYVHPHAHMLTRTEFVTSVFGGANAFVRFHQDADGAAESACMDIDTCCKRVTDGEAIDIARKAMRDLALADHDPATIAALDRRQRDSVLRHLRNSGLSVRQVARITGIGRNIVARA